MTDTAITALDPLDLVTHRGSPLVVHGPAGSGKTRLLIDRYLWLVSQGVMPERIAFVTPNPARADAVRACLEQELSDGYSELVSVTPAALAIAVMRRAGGRPDLADTVLSRGDRLAMLAEHVDELPLAHHDFGGNAGAMLGSFIRRIDRLKAELIGSDEYLAWAAQRDDSPHEREFAEIFAAHNRMVRELGACDEGDLVRMALTVVEDQASSAHGFTQVLADDAQELGLAAVKLVRAVGGGELTVCGDALGALMRFRGAGAQRMESFETAGTRVARLAGSRRCPGPIMQAAWAAALGSSEQSAPVPSAAGVVSFWRCTSDRAQAQSVAAEVERVISREHVPGAQIAVVVPDIAKEGRAVSLALHERAVTHTVVGEVSFYQRAEVRDLLAWLRLLADPNDASAVVRALARPPIDLRSVDIARCTQIARRRKIDMVAALAAATESPQVPPEARERIRFFLKLYRACSAHVDTMRADLYVHRLIDRLGLRRQQLFAAQADVVERLRALAEFGEIASAYVNRAPQATAREFAKSVAAIAEYGLRDEAEPELSAATGAGVQVIAMHAIGGLEVEHVYVLGLQGALASADELRSEQVPDELLHERLPPDDQHARAAQLRSRLYAAISRARGRVVLAYPASGERGAQTQPLDAVEDARRALGASWEDRDEELFGPAETLQSTFRLLRDELLAGTVRAGARLAELRLDTDLDVSHAVVRYLELLKVSALIAREEDQNIADTLRDINARINQAVTGEQREILQSSPLDEFLLDAERDTRRRAQVIAARDEPSLERFLPMRGDGVLLSATDIETYRSCPLKYKFARVFRIPQEPTIHQRFGIVVHQVLERFHASEREDLGPLAEILELLDHGWRRSGFGDSEEERQLRSKAVAALTRYHERAQHDDAQPVWFEKQFSFKLGPHLVRGRVDRVDKLASGEYELIDYKTGRPKTEQQLADDVQLSLYAIGARESWGLDASRGAYYYLLDDQKVAISGDAARTDWITELATEVAEGIKAQEFEPTPSPRACGLCDYRLVCPAAER